MTVRRAPIAVFIYRRPAHLRETLASLLRCRGVDDARIVVFGDGPRSAEQAPEVDAARSVARQILGDRAEYRFSAENRGLSASVIAGVGELLVDHDRVIVLEDDLLLSPGFLRFMEDALERYAHEDAVFQISGHIVGVPEFVSRREALFLPLTTSWGWATWRRAWRSFDPCAQGWECLRSDRELRSRFNVGGAVDYASMLERQMSSVGDSWAIRWYWSVFRQSGLVLFPPRPMIRNTGLDGSGTHGRGVLRRGPGRAFCDIGDLPGLPEAISVNAADYAVVRNALWSRNGGWLGQIADSVRRLQLRLRAPQWGRPSS